MREARFNASCHRASVTAPPVLPCCVPCESAGRSLRGFTQMLASDPRILTCIRGVRGSRTVLASEQVLVLTFAPMAIIPLLGLKQAPQAALHVQVTMRNSTTPCSMPVSPAERSGSSPCSLTQLLRGPSTPLPRRVTTLSQSIPCRLRAASCIARFQAAIILYFQAATSQASIQRPTENAKQRLVASVCFRRHSSLLHLPFGIKSVDWISENNYDFGIRPLRSNPRAESRVRYVGWRGFPSDLPPGPLLIPGKVPLEPFLFWRGGNPIVKNSKWQLARQPAQCFGPIKIVQFLASSWSNSWMHREIAVQSRTTRLLSAGNDK